jgi:osmotically inducible lipoprotein OsmB
MNKNRSRRAGEQMAGRSKSRGIATILVVAGLGLAATACGYSPGDRAVSGGMLGAGAGAVIGAATGGSPLTGALIGGGIGAVGGAVTSPHAVNLGRPLWD